MTRCTSQQFPQPIELPLDERESALPLRAQLIRFVITGGLSAVVDFGLLVILMQFGAGAHAGQGGVVRGRHDHRVPDQPALDLPGRAVQAPLPGRGGALRGDLRAAGGAVQPALHGADRARGSAGSACR